MSSGVSVVMAAYNAEQFVEQALTSALQQTSPPDTIVVVDDGSTDATADVAAAVSERVHVLEQPHQGIGRSRNAGLAVVEAEMIAFLDADDLWLPRKLERQLAAFDEEPSREAVFCLVDEFVDDEYPPPRGSRPPRSGQAAPLSSAALLRRSVIHRIGPFGDGAVSDWVEWWARARALGVGEHIVPEVLLRRRIHSSNNSMRSEGEHHEFLELAHRHLQAMRARRASGTEPTT